MAINADRRRIAHLLRRAGFGGTQDEIDAYTRLGFDGAVARLVDFEQVSDAGIEAQVRQMENDLDMTKLASIQAIWLQRMLGTARPLQEKMVLFWHDHFATANSKVNRPQAMYDQNNFFRANALGGFRDLLGGVSRDPAMLRYLDSNTNRKASPNENYGRELMELFTMGIGNYTQDDVHSAARAFTGWFIDKNYQFVFNKNQHDAGEKTYLGRTGKWDGDDVLNIIMQQPATGRYMTRKLYTYFIHDHPSQAAINQLADTFKNSGFKVRELVRAILMHPDFRSDDTYHNVVKSPAEYLIGSMKALGVQQFLPGIQGNLTRMGMNLFNPPNVAGWDWGTDWIGTNTFVERLNLAAGLTSQRDKTGDRGADPAAIVAQLGARTPEEVVDGLLSLLIDGDVDPQIRDGLVDYARGAYSGSPDSFLNDQQRLDRAVRGTAHLIMATPTFQMA